MQAERFISSRLRFGGRLAVCAIAVSFLIIIVSLAIASGFRSEIRSALSHTSGDIVVASTTALPAIDSVKGVTAVTPVVYKAGIVKSGWHILGVNFKGTATSDSVRLKVEIPESFARKMKLAEGDKMLSYFVGEKVQARNFTVSGIYPDIVGNDGAIVVKADIRDLQRLDGLKEDEFSALEVTLDPSLRERDKMNGKAREISFLTGAYSTSLPDRFPQLFDWLDLIDVNVLAILVLMAVVAGFNMISGLLIFLFRNTSTIGTLKALGMSDKGIGKVFLRVASRAVLKGMLIGNAAALLFCLIQGTTHLIKLDPANYFLSFVPVKVDFPIILAADAAAFAVIMVMMALPTLFISKVDPARTVRSL